MAHLEAENFRLASVANRWAQEYVHLAFAPAMAKSLEREVLAADRILRSPKESNEAAGLAHFIIGTKLNSIRGMADNQNHVNAALNELNKVLGLLAFTTPIPVPVDPNAPVATPNLIGTGSKGRGRPLPPDGTILTATDSRAQGKTATVKEGKIVYGDRTFDSMTGAAMAVVADLGLNLKAVNGWAFWSTT